MSYALSLKVLLRNVKKKISLGFLVQLSLLTEEYVPLYNGLYQSLRGRRKRKVE